LSDQTAAYLNSVELEPLWASILSSPCYREVGADQDAWVDLYAAIARRNASDIVRLGTGLLASGAAHSDGQVAYLTTITAAAYVNLGRDAEAHALLQSQWSRFNHAGPFEFALRDLRALTEPRAQSFGAPAASHAVHPAPSSWVAARAAVRPTRIPPR
jgi:hypothetical protein